MNRIVLCLIMTQAVAGGIILLACGLAHFTGEKTGYRWRRILWIVLAVRLLVPVQLIQSASPLSEYLFQVEMPEKLRGTEDTVRKENAEEDTRTGAPEAGAGENSAAEGSAHDSSVTEYIAADGNLTADSREIAAVPESTADKDVENREVKTAGEVLAEALRDGTAARISAGIWLIVAAGLLGIRSLQYRMLFRKIGRETRRCRDPQINRLVQEIGRNMGIKKIPSVRTGRALSTPVLYERRKPVILMPERRYDVREAEMILRHELQHYRSRDLWYKLLIMAVCDIYWFNPLLRLMKRAAWQDLECICDENVTDNLSLRDKKIYASIILRSASGKRNSPAFGTQFSMGRSAASVRIRNIFRRKSRLGWVIFAVLAAMIIGGTCLWNITEPAGTDKAAPVSAETEEAEEPVFYADTMEEVALTDQFRLENYYITNKITAQTRYYIDQNAVLWAYGSNNYGQLGNGEVNDLDTFYRDPVRISGNAVSVDASVNGYFFIYLTSDGNLYGAGGNIHDILGKGQGDTDIAGESYRAVTSPVLLMENVAYARAGKESIAALRNDGTVWWWGRYEGTYHVSEDSLLYLNEENIQSEDNPLWMQSTAPRKILDHCIYAVTGDTFGAAIGENGELYTWGRNIMGECGTAVTGDDFLRKPRKVLDDVQMVWPERIGFNSTEEEIPESMEYNTTYGFNMFVRMKGGNFMASGEGLGDLKTETQITGDLVYPEEHLYSDTFVPIRIREYAETEIRSSLQRLKWGMDIDEVCGILDREPGRQFYTVYRSAPDAPEAEGTDRYIDVGDGDYRLEFDSTLRLTAVIMQKGGSRSGIFTMGMTKEEAEKLAGTEIRLYMDDEEGIYWTEETLDGTRYGFRLDDSGRIYAVLECSSREAFLDLW